VGFVVDKVALGQVFADYFGFPCQFSFHQLLYNHHLSSGACTIGQKWPQYLGIYFHPTNNKKKIKNMLKLSDNVTARPECLKIYLPLRNFQEVYECFNKEISVTRLTKLLPISLPPRDIISGLHNLLQLLKIYLFDLSGRDNQCPLVATST
jgi:hypothetical protein